jgi:mono/diheme cytochrome c family protein
VRGFINGVIFTLALLAGGGYVAVLLSVMPAGADRKPSRLERWAANTSLRATIARETKGSSDPLQPTDANLIDGIRLYGQNCAVCHGAADAAQSTIAKGFYIRAPQLAKDGVEDDPETETYWKVAHGIRFTAMPAFGTTLSEDDIWKLALFLKRMDALPAAAQAEWKKVPSSAPSPAP